MYTLLITCPRGLSSTLHQELKHLGYKPTDTFDTGTFVHTDRDGIMHLHLRSRIASKISVQIGTGRICQTFDELYNFVNSLSRKQRLPASEYLSIQVHSNASTLFAETSIQSIVHKAALVKIMESEQTVAIPNKQPYEIMCQLHHDICSVYLNLSGAGLHQRGYRTEAGDAPLKENIAAALVITSGRRRQDILRDPCCGSGTICIEAALIARNIAPGLTRSFAFQSMIGYDTGRFDTLKQEAEKKSYRGKTYMIRGTDKDPAVLEKARNNAERAGVADTISFETADIISDEIPFDTGEKHLHIVTNPPYGKRLADEALDDIYIKLITLSEVPTHHLTMVTGYARTVSLLPALWPKKERTNGADPVIVRMKPKG